MARMYSGRKGKSGSKKPLTDTKPSWVKYSVEEVEKLIAKLAKTGKTPSQIGMILRDSYGIPEVRKIINKKLTKSLIDQKLSLEIPEDLTALIKKDIKIINHRKTHKKDQTSKRGIILTESKINKLVKYYKSKGKLPENWVYDRTKARLFI